MGFLMRKHLLGPRLPSPPPCCLGDENMNKSLLGHGHGEASLRPELYCSFVWCLIWEGLCVTWQSSSVEFSSTDSCFVAADHRGPVGSKERKPEKTPDLGREKR